MFPISHKLVYLSLSILYASSCFGLDKVILGALLAAAYGLLALARQH